MPKPIKWEKAVAADDLSIFITKDTVHMYGGNIDTSALPRMIAQQKHQLDLYTQIYEQWKKEFN